MLEILLVFFFWSHCDNPNQAVNAQDQLKIGGCSFQMLKSYIYHLKKCQCHCQMFSNLGINHPFTFFFFGRNKIKIQQTWRGLQTLLFSQINNHIVWLDLFKFSVEVWWSRWFYGWQGQWMPAYLESERHWGEHSTLLDYAL